MLRLVPTPIGNIADMTFRAMEALQDADVLLCEDTRVTKQLISILKERYSFSPKTDQRFISLHSHNETAFIQKLSPEFFDQNVVYVSDAGMPGISDPGAALVRYVQQHAIEYEVLPGANAVLTAYVASGFVQNRFLFFGFLPHKSKERQKELYSALFSGYTTILYESPHRLLKLLQEIDELDASRELFLAKELTKRYEKFYKGTAATLLKELGGSVKGEWVVVCAPLATAAAHSSSLSAADIQELDIPKKQKAKLLSKLTGRSIKELYNEML